MTWPVRWSIGGESWRFVMAISPSRSNSSAGRSGDSRPGSPVLPCSGRPWRGRSNGWMPVRCSGRHCIGTRLQRLFVWNWRLLSWSSANQKSRQICLLLCRIHLLGLLRGLRARAAVQAASEDHQAAASLAAEALRLDSRLPESLLFEWLQTVGGLLLCHRWGEARAWLEALTVQTPAVTAVSNPIPRRIAWIARLALELVQPSSIDLEHELNELYLLRWLPPSRTEHQVWDAWLEAFLHSVAGELEQDDQRDLGRCRIVLEAILPALSGVRTPQRRDGGLVSGWNGWCRAVNPGRRAPRLSCRWPCNGRATTGWP